MIEQYSLLKHILFINLDHRTDRLSHINNEFNNKLKIPNVVPERFSAIQHIKGSIGCT